MKERRGGTCCVLGSTGMNGCSDDEGGGALSARVSHTLMSGGWPRRKAYVRGGAERERLEEGREGEGTVQKARDLFTTGSDCR